MKKQISTETVPPPAGAYSTGIVANGMLYCAGQGPFDATGARVGDTFEEQVRITLRNLADVAEAAGTSLAHAVRFGVFLSDIENFDALNAVMREFVPEPFPARTTIQAPLKGFDVEIDAVILVPEG